MTFKTYETTREIFDCLVDFHYRAAAMAETAMDQEQDARVKLVFNFLYDHHLQMQEALATYEDDEEQAVLNTPVSFSLDATRAPEAFLQGAEFNSGISFEEAQRLGKSLGDYVLELMEDIQEEIADDDVRDVVARMGEIELEEHKLLMRGIATLKDF